MLRSRFRRTATALAVLLAGAATACGIALTVGAFSNDGEFVHENPNVVTAARA